MFKKQKALSPRSCSQPSAEHGRLVPGRHETPVKGNSSEAVTNLPWTAWNACTQPPLPSPSLEVVPALTTASSGSWPFFSHRCLLNKLLCDCLPPLSLLLRGTRLKQDTKGAVFHTYSSKSLNADDLQLKSRGMG